MMSPQNNISRVVIICGPPGAGKGTQAEMLVDKHSFYHFETSKIIEYALTTNPETASVEVDGMHYTYQEEKRKFSSGELNTPAVVAFWVKEKLKELAAQQQSLVFSGSPRTLYEADQLFPALIAFFSKDNVCVIELQVAPNVSIDRNTHRRICSVCRLPHTQSYQKDTCKKCGGTLVKRGALDTEPVIRKRLTEFSERTEPAMLHAKDYGLAFYRIDGARSEQAVFEDICRVCNL